MSDAEPCDHMASWCRTDRGVHECFWCGFEWPFGADKNKPFQIPLDFRPKAKRTKRKNKDPK